MEYFIHIPNYQDYKEIQQKLFDEGFKWVKRHQEDRLLNIDEHLSVNTEYMTMSIKKLKKDASSVNIDRFLKTYKNSPKNTESYDFVNPNHYKTSGKKEVWEMMVDIWGKEAFIEHCEMNAFKYRMRLGKKPEQSVERDLNKAQWYEAKAKELKTC